MTQHRFEQSLKNLQQIQEKNDRVQLVRDLEVNKERLKVAEAALKEAVDRWDFESIHKDVLDLKWSIQQAENLIAKPGYMSTMETFTEAEATGIIQQYNDEMIVAAKKYQTLINRVNKIMKISVEDLQKEVDEMKSIEKQRLDVHSLQNYLPKNRHEELISFPLKEVTKPNLVQVSAAEHIQSIISLIKEAEVLK